MNETKKRREESSSMEEEEDGRFCEDKKENKESFKQKY